MVELRPESLAHAARIRDTYGRQVTTLALADRDALREALEAGDVVRIPADAPGFNVAPRVDGPYRIAELDPAHQPLYLSARPETIGMLLDTASRLQHGPLDVTSLVFHVVPAAQRRAYYRGGAQAVMLASTPEHLYPWRVLVRSAPASLQDSPAWATTRPPLPTVAWAHDRRLAYVPAPLLALDRRLAVRAGSGLVWWEWLVVMGAVTAGLTVTRRARNAARRRPNSTRPHRASTAPAGNPTTARPAP